MLIQRYEKSPQSVINYSQHFTLFQINSFYFIFILFVQFSVPFIIKLKFIITNVLMIKRQSKESLQSASVLSNGTFKTNSNQNLINQSFGYEQYQKTQINSCPFCFCKQTILSSLQTLKQIIYAKNQKIKQLQLFIQKLSTMAFNQSAQYQMESGRKAQRKPKDELQDIQQDDRQITFSHRLPSPRLIQNLKDSFQQTDRVNKKTKVEAISFASGKSSQVKAEIPVNQQQNMKIQIKKHIQNMNLDRQKDVQTVDTAKITKESLLRKKLKQIINVLPYSQHGAGLQYFQTLSEPLNEGSAGIINSKVSNHKIVKHSGFIKKGQIYDQILSKGDLMHNSNKSSEGNQKSV